jgi:conjugal transfer ATP-binding protein TraC
MGSGVGRLLLDPFSMMLFSTRAEDFERIKTMREEMGMTTEQAIEVLLDEKMKNDRRKTSGEDRRKYKEKP